MAECRRGAHTVFEVHLHLVWITEKAGVHRAFMARHGHAGYRSRRMYGLIRTLLRKHHTPPRCSKSRSTGTVVRSTSASNRTTFPSTVSAPAARTWRPAVFNLRSGRTGAGNQKGSDERGRRAIRARD